MAARAGRENAVADAVVARMRIAAEARLSGDVPGILSVFVDDLDRTEWRSLRETLQLEGAVRRFLTTPVGAARRRDSLRVAHGNVRHGPARRGAGRGTALPQPWAPRRQIGGAGAGGDVDRLKAAARTLACPLPPPPPAGRPPLRPRHPRRTVPH